MQRKFLQKPDLQASPLEQDLPLSRGSSTQTKLKGSNQRAARAGVISGLRLKLLWSTGGRADAFARDTAMAVSMIERKCMMWIIAIK